ncbi:MAG: protein disulfide-isomerase precursor [Thelocarpon superellum]|nr:MAG: protein disulfide-isomerase precursor [Thelocarpon superellum]
MGNFRNAVVGLLGATALASASDVHDLKKDTFEPFVKEHDLVLAESLAPEYEEAATKLKEKDIALVKVDCTEEAELCQSYGVEGYPTVKVFRGPDNVQPYNGQRKAPAIISYMTKQSLPAVSTITAETIEEFKTADKVVLVAFFDASDKHSNESFDALAEGLRDTYLFGATSDLALAKAEGVQQPSIVLYKQFDEGKNIFVDKFDKAAIEAFAKTSAIPLVGEVGPETYADYMAAGIPLAYIFAETAEERTELAELLKPVAEKHRGKISLATIDAKAFGAHAANLNLDTEKFPAFAIQETVKNQKFPFDQTKALTHDDVGSFVQDFLDGKMAPSIKSEPVPETQDGPVQVVVAHNYQDIVMAEDTDVLLEFYAPWCGHCKALAPKYEELAALYTTNPDYAKKVVVAKVDATANDVPEDIQGFPTIKLFPAGAKTAPIDYSGSRTIEDLANFIKENGKYKVDVYHAADADTDMPDAEAMGQQAPAASEKVADATDKVKSKVSEAAEAVKTAVADSDDDGSDHDEL